MKEKGFGCFFFIVFCFIFWDISGLQVYGQTNDTATNNTEPDVISDTIANSSTATPEVKDPSDNATESESSYDGPVNGTSLSDGVNDFVTSSNETTLGEEGLASTSTGNESRNSTDLETNTSSHETGNEIDDIFQDGDSEDLHIVNDTLVVPMNNGTAEESGGDLSVNKTEDLLTDKNMSEDFIDPSYNETTGYLSNNTLDNDTFEEVAVEGSTSETSFKDTSEVPIIHNTTEDSASETLANNDPKEALPANETYQAVINTTSVSNLTDYQTGISIHNEISEEMDNSTLIDTPETVYDETASVSTVNGTAEESMEEDTSVNDTTDVFLPETHLQSHLASENNTAGAPKDQTLNSTVLILNNNTDSLPVESLEITTAGYDQNSTEELERTFTDASGALETEEADSHLDVSTADLTNAENTTVTSLTIDISPTNASSQTEGATSPSYDTSGTPSDTKTVEQAQYYAEEKADFVVLDDDNNPCLLASLNITIHFVYRVQEGLVRETYDTVSKKTVGDDSSYSGSCGDNISKLSIAWNNDTFTLNLTFSLQDADNRGPDLHMDVRPTVVNTSISWSLQQVSLSYDTANENVFPGAFNPAMESVNAENLNLFHTPLHLSYFCQTPEAVGIQFKDVDLVFNYVYLQPFGVTSQRFTNESVECSSDLVSLPMTESYIVPLIVAACLASAVIIIIIGYAAFRYVSKRLRQADYKQMD